MFTDRRDYLMQMIERIVAGLIEQVRRGLDGDPKELEELDRECERAMDDEFAELHVRVRDLASRSVADVIRPVGRLRSYALLLGGRVLLQERKAMLDPKCAVQTDAPRDQARRALELVLEAVLADQVTSADRALCPELFRIAGPEELEPRYLQALIVIGEDAQ